LDDVVAETSRFPVCEFETSVTITAYKVYNVSKDRAEGEGRVGEGAEVGGLGAAFGVGPVVLWGMGVNGFVFDEGKLRRCFGLRSEIGFVSEFFAEAAEAV
ncbi:MAG: hypothetical protein ABI806_02775, partial [Candidatus Solibacter sp.]